jgi:hypothetical protein
MRASCFTRCVRAGCAGRACPDPKLALRPFCRQNQQICEAAWRVRQPSAAMCRICSGRVLRKMPHGERPSSVRDRESCWYSRASCVFVRLPEENGRVFSTLEHTGDHRQSPAKLLAGKPGTRRVRSRPQRREARAIDCHVPVTKADYGSRGDYAKSGAKNRPADGAPLTSTALRELRPAALRERGEHERESSPKRLRAARTARFTR